MKKTIILSALTLGVAASALATNSETIPDSILSLTPEDTMTGNYTNAHTIAGANISGMTSNNRAALTAVFMLDWEELTQLSFFTNGTLKSGSWLYSSTSNRNVGFGLIRSEEGNAVDFTLQVMHGNSSYVKDGVGYTLAHLSDYVNPDGKLTLAMSLGDNGLTLYALGGSDAAGYSKTEATGLKWTDGWPADNSYPYSNFHFEEIASAVDYVQLYNTTLDDAQVYKVMMLIPEPTTATLSLFALAGLAIRRRRH